MEEIPYFVYSLISVQILLFRKKYFHYRIIKKRNKPTLTDYQAHANVFRLLDFQFRYFHSNYYLHIPVIMCLYACIEKEGITLWNWSIIWWKSNLPSCTSIPSCFSNSRNFWISSLSSLISFAFASSLTTALQTICFALSAYL